MSDDLTQAVKDNEYLSSTFDRYAQPCVELFVVPVVSIFRHSRYKFETR